MRLSSGYRAGRDHVQRRSAARRDADARGHLLPDDVRVHRRRLRRDGEELREGLHPAARRGSRRPRRCDAAQPIRAEVVPSSRRHFHEVFEGIDQNVKDLFTEASPSTRTRTPSCTRSSRCGASRSSRASTDNGQEQLMATIDELMLADGEAHPAEVQFRAELPQLLEARARHRGRSRRRRVRALGAGRQPAALGAEHVDHPFFEPFEFHYSSDPAPSRGRSPRIGSSSIARSRCGDAAPEGRRQAHRQEERRRVRGHRAVPRRPRLRPHAEAPGSNYELTVLGDLHGCYSILKATVLQSRFFEQGRRLPQGSEDNPEPAPHPARRLHRSRPLQLNGVLRTALQLFVTAPESRGHAPRQPRVLRRARRARCTAA